jgi:hypothetical protein
LPFQGHAFNRARFNREIVDDLPGEHGLPWPVMNSPQSMETWFPGE